MRFAFEANTTLLCDALAGIELISPELCHIGREWIRAAACQDLIAEDERLLSFERTAMLTNFILMTPLSLSLISVESHRRALVQRTRHC